MRIALLTTDWRLTGGVARYVRSISGVLARAGHDVLVIHDGAADESAPGGVTLAAVPDALRASASRDPTAAARVADVVKRFAPDVAHFHSSNNFPLEDAVANLAPSTKTLHVHEYCPSGTKYHFALDRACTYRTGPMCVPRMGYLRCTPSRRPTVWWQAYRHTAAANTHHRGFAEIIVCSEYAKREAVANGFDARRVSAVPLFTALPDEVRPARSRRILFAGRLVRSKGADLLLEALASVPGAWRAVIAGDGPEAASLRRLVARRGWSDRVEFPGWLDEAGMTAAYRDADVVAMPSRWPEPFGLVGLEAMARARPVVAFATGAIPEWLSSGVGGELVAPHDVRAFGERIGWLLDHPDDAARVAQAGRARIAREFSAEVHLGRLMSIYDRLRAAR